MTNSTSKMNGATANSKTAAETKQIVLKEISATWGKLFEQDLSTLKSKHDLVAQVVAKYGSLDRRFGALLEGRQLYR